jgi:hypothetical protein
VKFCPPKVYGLPCNAAIVVVPPVEPVGPLDPEREESHRPCTTRVDPRPWGFDIAGTGILGCVGATGPAKRRDGPAQSTATLGVFDSPIGTSTNNVVCCP